MPRIANDPTRLILGDTASGLRKRIDEVIDEGMAARTKTLMADCKESEDLIRKGFEKLFRTLTNENMHPHKPHKQKKPEAKKSAKKTATQKMHTTSPDSTKKKTWWGHLPENKERFEAWRKKQLARLQQAAKEKAKKEARS